jgi:hypothetical protein
MIPRRLDRLSERFDGMWYVETEPSHYLHSDGVIRKGTLNESTGKWTGYYDSKEWAEAVIGQYKKDSQGPRLFVWEGFAPNYTDGLAFAIAENVEEAKQMVINAVGYDPSDWGELCELPISERVSFAVSGGG